MRWDVETVTDWLLEAGGIGLGYYGHISASNKPDATLVTAADVEIEKDFIQRFGALGMAEDEFLGEETCGNDRNRWLQGRKNGTAFILDPIDGTANFANRHPMWGISVGFLDNGCLTEGALYFPCDGDLWITDGDRVIYKRVEDGLVAESHPALRGTCLPYGQGLLALSQDIMLSYDMNFTGVKHLVSSCTYSMACLLQGKYLGAIFHVTLWDIAGAYPILAKLGMDAFWLDGSRVSRDVGSWFDADQESSDIWRLRLPFYFKPPEVDLYFHALPDGRLVADQQPGEYQDA